MERFKKATSEGHSAFVLGHNNCRYKRADYINAWNDGYANAESKYKTGDDTYRYMILFARFLHNARVERARRMVKAISSTMNGTYALSGHPYSR